MKLPVGKLPNSLLEEKVFHALGAKREDVVQAAAIGQDTAMVDFGEDYCVLSVDPITGAAEEVGKLAVNVSLNDIATAGALPVGLMVTLLLPEGSEIGEVTTIMDEMSAECEKWGAAILGGHTEITDAVNRITVITTAIGKLPREAYRKRATVKPGDAVVLSKVLALEGLWILTNTHRQALTQRLGEETVARLLDLGEHLSVMKEGLLGRRYGIGYMHDVTEGGLFGALWETAAAVGHGLIAHAEDIPHFDDEEALLACFPGIDPFRLIGSGSMLMVVPREMLDDFLEDAALEELTVTVIGEITAEKEVLLSSGDVLVPLEEPGSDELYRALTMEV